jgi:valyl-tRNA synthetase
MLATTLESILRMLHPIAPFVTEAIWQELPWTDSQLTTEQWPNIKLQYDSANADKFEREIIEVLAQKAAGETRQQRKALERELTLKQNAVRLSEQKLAGEAFVANAPEAVVTAERKRLEDAKIAVKELQLSIDQLED